MNPDGSTIYIVIFVLIILSGFFSMSETAFNSCNKIRMRVKANDGNKAAKIVCKLNDDSSKTLITILVGNNIVNYFVSILAAVVFGYFLSTSSDISDLVATLVVTAVVYVFGETLPKSFARAKADSVALFSAYIIYIFMIILWPITIIFRGLNKLVEIIFKMKDEPIMTEDDFTNVIEEIEEQGIIEENESDIIQNALDFDDTQVKEVLTPREKIFALDINNINHDNLRDILNSVSYSRIPIYKGSIDNIIGILHVRKYLKDYLSNKDVKIESCLMKPYFVSNKDTVEKIFDGFKKNKTHVAIVRNNLKQTIGMVTMDDILEELIGEFSKEGTFLIKKNLNKGGKNK